MQGFQDVVDFCCHEGRVVLLDEVTAALGDFHLGFLIWRLGLDEAGEAFVVRAPCRIYIGIDDRLWYRQ